LKDAWTPFPDEIGIAGRPPRGLVALPRHAGTIPRILVLRRSAGLIAAAWW